MRFPSWLYKLAAQDEGSQQLEACWREGTSGIGSATVGLAIYEVPGDKCLILTNVACTFTPGAGQNVLRRRVMADPPAGNVRFNILDEEADGAADVSMSSNWQGEVVIPPRWKVRVEGQYNLGAVANTTNGEIFGYLIPRGSFNF